MTTINTDRQSAPAQWRTTHYVVRRPGHAAWSEEQSHASARAEAEYANRSIAPGHRVYAVQEYAGDLAALKGETRTVER